MKRLGFLLATLLLASLARAADWPQWRGPAQNGSSDEKGLPVKWSKTENIAWTAALPGVAASTPIVCGSRVFLTGVDDEKNTLVAQAFDRKTGRLVWQHEVARGVRRDRRSNFASSSPVTDGKHAIFFYGTGDLACYDFEGKLEWSRNLQKDYGPFATMWTFSSSPLLFDGRLYVQVLIRDVPVDGRGRADGPNDSYLLALDPATGKMQWRVVRESAAVAESREAFSTPVATPWAGGHLILIAGGDALSGHDPQTGKELWRWDHWNPERIPHWRLVPSPVAGGSVTLVCAPKGDPIYAIKLGGAGTLGKESVAWSSAGQREVTSDVPTPTFYDGDFFVLSDLKKSLSRIEPSTGKIKWKISVPGRTKYEASPTVADGKIYLLNFAGEASVIDAADGKLLGQATMDDPAGGDVNRATIAVSGGQLFLRTTRVLYCIGK